jgi:hypothetical protein
MEKKKRPTPTEVLREFIEDVEAVGEEHVATEWPDLVETYRKAKEALPRTRRTKKEKTCPK